MKKKQSKTKPVSIRIPRDQLLKAKQQGVNISEVMRKALALSLNTCPTCGKDSDY